MRFTAVDLPEVDTLTVHILAAVAEKQAKMISTRTKDALTAAKARGGTLGTPANLTHAAQLQGAPPAGARGHGLPVVASWWRRVMRC